ncbi:MAG TPA: hypothetical protein VFF06_03685 [Polyangia bacterium]|nr:hypothetical protein [Polyangia bacterium]
MNTFAERVGGVLVAPRRALEAAARAPQGRGVGDVTWLIAARLVAGEAPRLVRAAARLRAFGVGAGVQSLASVAGQVLPDVAGVLIASMVMSLFLPASRARAGSPIDVAAYAWVPYLAVELLAALAFTALGRAPSPTEKHVADAIALGWALAIWIVGLIVLRREREAAAS